jgi:hypothetical protein
MVRIRNILCPVDFSDASTHEIDLAVEIGRAFGATVVLHHNLAATAPGFSKGWEWQETHRQTRGSVTDVESRLRELMRQIDPSVPAGGDHLGAAVPRPLHRRGAATISRSGSHGQARRTMTSASVCDAAALSAVVFRKR